MSPLTSEQLARIQENRKKALEKRALRARIEANRLKALQIQAAKKKGNPSGIRLKTPEVRVLELEAMGSSVICDKPTTMSVKDTFPGHSVVRSGTLSSSAASVEIQTTNPSASKLLKTFSMSDPVSTLSMSPKGVVKNILTGQCVMVTKDHFCVNVGYHRVMIDIFKRIKSASYVCSKKIWRFHISDHDTLLLELAPLKSEVSISGIPQRILAMFKKPFVEFKNLNSRLSKIDPHLLDHIMAFQREGIMFGISRNGRCLIADDMGLGKTIQALGIAHYYVEDWPVLIVCPTSVRYQWMEAVHDWLPSVPPHSVCVMTSGKDYDSNSKILITSYSIASRHTSILSKYSFGVVIVDESHFMKNYSSARTKAVCTILKKSKRVMLLSGTPALSRPVELFTQLNAIDSKTFPNFREYGIRYCDGKLSKMGFWDYSGCSNMEELHLVLTQSVMIRRMKSEVISQLPSKLRQMILLNPGEVTKNKNFKEFEKALQSKSLKGMERRGTLLQYYAYSGKCKIPAILEYVNDQLESGRKFIIFAHHKAVLDAICDAVAKKNVNYIKIDGSTSSLTRKQMCDKFQHNDKYVVAILSITAANAGLTLTAAQLVIFAELFWNPGILTQAEDRAHRIGQRDCVLVQYLVSPGTADDHLWPLIQTKLEVLNKAGLSKDSFQSCDTSSVTFKNNFQKTIEDFFSSLDDGDLLQAFDSVNTES